MTATAGDTLTTQERASPQLMLPAWTLLLPVAAALLLMVIASQRSDGRLHLWVLDVGQGDAILLRTPTGRTALIDGGPGATPLLNSVDERIPFWQRDLDLLVLTHPHADHLMGLIEVVQRRRVDQVVQTAFTATSATETEWQRQLKERAVPVYYAQRGDEIRFEGEEEVSLRVLNPVSADAAKEDEDVNDASLVLQLTYGRHSILLTGDVQAEAESEILRREGKELDADVLKVGHHGSGTSSTPQFLDAVSPRLAVISVGAGNRFGHPASQTLDALEEARAQVYRTDLDGTVEIIADKERLWVRSER